MKTLFHTLAVILAFVLCTQRARAQTVESVLRAMQERNFVIQAGYSTPSTASLTPIHWGGGIDDYPSDGTIDNLQAALDALNLASKTYDGFSRIFSSQPGDDSVVAWKPDYPVVKHAYFTDTNWRRKIRDLALNIDNNLKSLQWPMLASQRSQSLIDYAGPGGWKLLDFRIWSDTVIVADYAVDVYNLTRPGNGGYPGYYSHGVTGVKAKLKGYGDFPIVAGMDPVSSGTIQVKLTAEQARSGLYTHGLKISSTFQSSPSTKDIKLGDYYEAPVDFSGRVDGRNQGGFHRYDFITGVGSDVTAEESDAATNFLKNGPLWMELTVNVDGSWDDSQPPDSDFSYSYLHPAESAPFSTEMLNALQVEYSAKATAIAYRVPVFTPILTSNGKSIAESKHFPGEVEILSSEPPDDDPTDLIPKVRDISQLRIYIGRGKVDSSQSAFLSIPVDGFGTMEPYGCSEQFDVVYEKDPAKYSDLLVPPLTDVTGISDEKLSSGIWFTELNLNDPLAPFEAYYDYFQRWVKPRLLKVKGRDATVKIEYKTSYSRTLKFFWNTEADSDNPVPFKTIVVKNPTAPEDVPGFATDHHHLQIEENGITHKIVTAENGDITYDATGAVTRHAGRAKAIDPDTGTYTDTYTETYTDGGKTWTTTIDKWSAEGDPTVISATSPDGDTRVTTATWDPGHILTGISYTGPASWSENGRVLTFDNYGLLTDTHGSEDKPIFIDSSFSGNTRTTTTYIGGEVAKDETGTSSDHLKKTKFEVDSDLIATVTYRDGDGGGFLPWSLKHILYPGAYQKSFEIKPATMPKNAGETGTDSPAVEAQPASTIVEAGFGSEFTSGTKDETKFSSFGEVISHEVETTDGTKMLSDVGSDFTAWGAPKTITHLRGDKDTIKYNENGVKFGTIASTEDGQGVKTSTEYDNRLRPTSFDTGSEKFTNDYSDPLKSKWTSDKGYFNSVTVNAFGDLKEKESTFGAGSKFVLNPGATSTLTVDGRSKTLDIDTSGFMSKSSGGAGSRGAKMEFGVEYGYNYTRSKGLQKSGVEGGQEITTYYDQQGRVLKNVFKGSDGGDIFEQWRYDDENRRVTYTPPAGPTSQEMITTVSADGATTIVSLGGVDSSRTIRSEEGGVITVTKAIYDDSGGGGASWTEVSSETFTPSSGISTSRSWGRNANTTTITHPEPAPTGAVVVSGGVTDDTLATTLTGGVPTKVEGTANGVSVNLDHITLSGTAISAVTGSIGGQTSGISIGDDRRVSRIYGPGSDLNFTHAGGGSFATTVADSEQGTSNTQASDSDGDLTAATGDGSLDLNAETTDTEAGRSTVVNAKLTAKSDFLGFCLGKNYAGGLNETYLRSADGSLLELTISGNGLSLSRSIVETPHQRTVSDSDGTVIEHFFNAGPRKSVEAPNDARTFTYQELKPLTETHTGGPWSGWSLKWVLNDKGLLQNLEVSSAGVLKKLFGYGYDAHANFALSSSSGIAAVYVRGTTGSISGLSRGPVASTWTYDDSKGELKSLTNRNSAGANFDYSYANHDQRHRITSRHASQGVNWSNLNYDSKDELNSANLSTGRSLAYDYNNRGTRRGEGTLGTNTVNDLDQVTERALNSRGFGVFGEVSPKATVKSFNPLLPPAGDSLAVDVVTGAFFGWWTVPQDWNNGNAGRVDALFRATIAPSATIVKPLVAEQSLSFIIPPALETRVHDGIGRLVSDAFWNYTWDDSSRLTEMVRKAGTFAAPNTASDAVTFIYDADGRRTQKTRTIKTTSGNVVTTRVEVSKVLWAGWLPVREERSVNGGFVSGRWFQWGADISGTLDGAGGIGGLVAILEDGNNGRTLVPVQDGLGNITAVINAADGKTIARYDFGPYGEKLGESGEVDACPFRYQSKWYDAESEHYYFGYRYYDSRYGSWLSRDPMGEAGGLNLYAYCGNDPVNRHDPVGLDWDNNWEDLKFVLGGIPEGLSQSPENIKNIGRGLQRGKDDFSEFLHTLFTNPKQIGRGIRNTVATVGTYYGAVSVDGSQYFDDFSNGLDQVGESLNTQEKAFQATGQAIFTLTTIEVGGAWTGGPARGSAAMRLGRQPLLIDPVIDADVLVRAFAGSKGLGGVNEQAALSLLRNTRYQWVVSPSTFKEFVKVSGGGARKAFLNRFSNVEILTGPKAAALRQGDAFNSAFNQLRSIANRSRVGMGDRAVAGGLKSHFMDIVNASFAKELGIPYVTGDKKFINFLLNHGKPVEVPVFHYLSPP